MPANVRDLPSRPVWGNHVDDGKSLVRQAEQLRSASVREDGATLTSEHGGEHPTCPAYRPVANCERPAEEGLQIPRRDPVIDCAVTKPELSQLSPCDNPMLLSRQRRNRVY